MLYDILLRFCIGKIGLVSDIKQAFHQIEIAKEHRDYLRFLWFMNEGDKQPTILRFKRVNFGINCGPFLLNGTIDTYLSKLAELGIDSKELQTFLRDLYVDDFTTSFDNEDEGFKLYEKSTANLQSAGFPLRKWWTSDSNLQSRIDLQQQQLDATTCTTSTDNQTRKVLGVSWDFCHDSFVFDFNDMIACAESLPVTKRLVLRVSAMFFDPLGLICPIVLQAKLLFKRVQSWSGGLVV